MDKTDYSLNNYDDENLESTDNKFAQPQTSEAKEISNFLSQFKKQTSTSLQPKDLESWRIRCFEMMRDGSKTN